MIKKLLSCAINGAALLGPLMCFPAHSAGPSNVPLNGTLTYQDRITSPGQGNCPISGMTVGTGTVSHLGKSAVVSTACISFDQGVYTILSSTITVTAANGDTLTGSYAGAFYPTAIPAIYELKNGVLTITGGTGRFKNAAGSGTLISTENLSTGEGTISVVGAISYPH